MAAILLLKRYELSSGRVLLSGARPALRVFFARGLWWTTRVLPGAADRAARRGGEWVRTTAQRILARGALLTEQGLEKALHTVQRTTSTPAAGGEASPFLREVAEHKKKLQEDRPDTQ
jgi:hypothetical protein